MDALNAFELGQDLSQRNGYLPQVPTGAEILRGAGYYTSHSGKMSNRWNMDEDLWMSRKFRKWREETVENKRGEKRREEKREKRKENRREEKRRKEKKREEKRRKEKKGEEMRR